MRILMLVHSLRRGGAERVLLDLAVGLKTRGHIVKVVSWIDIDDYQEQRYSSVPRVYLMTKDQYRWPWSVPTAAKYLRQTVNKFRPDVVEIHTPTVAWVAAWAHLGTPCVHVLHGHGGITPDNSIKAKARRVVDCLAHRRLRPMFIAVSPAIVGLAATHFLMAPSRLSCVPNGVDAHTFKASTRPKGGGPCILMVGTLCSKKGQALAIRAFGQMLHECPGARLTVVGDGPDRAILEKMVTRDHLEGKVIFLGQRVDVADILADAHVLWHLSDSEGLPMAVLEAMAMGVPVVGFDVPGTRDVVADGRTGFLARYGDIEAVAQRTLDLLRDPSQYQLFSLDARRRVEEDFSATRMIDGHERVLLSAVQVHDACE